MSVELLPPTPQYKNEWHVRPNHCRCHPETCCCDGWAIHKPNGEKYSTMYQKKDAEEFANFKNWNES